MNKSPTVAHHPPARLWRALLACTLLLAAGCGPDTNSGGEGDDPCDPVRIETDVSEEIAGETGADRHVVTYEPGTGAFRVEVLDTDGGSMGTVVFDEFDTMTNLIDGFGQSTSEDDDVTLGSHTIRVQPADSAETVIETEAFRTASDHSSVAQHARIRSNDKSVDFWMQSDGPSEAARRLVGVPAAEVDGDPDLEPTYVDGFAPYYVYDATANPTTDKALVSWLTALDRGEVFDAETRELLRLGTADLTWVRDLSDAYRSCRRDEPGGADREADGRLTRRSAIAFGCPPDNTFGGGPTTSWFDVIPLLVSAYDCFCNQPGNCDDDDDEEPEPAPEPMCDALECAEQCNQYETPCVDTTAMCECKEREKIRGDLYRCVREVCDCDFHDKDCSENTGDPHITTFDGLAYDFQAVGEFVLIESREADDRSPSRPLQIHIRTAAVGADNCPEVSYNTGVAAQIGPHRVAIYPNGESAGSVIIDGEPATVAVGYDTPIEADRLVRLSESTYRLVWETGEILEVDVESRSLDMRMSVPESRAAQVRGLWGNADGDRSDDLRTREGTDLEQPIDWETMYGQYTDSWRVTQEESLLDYGDGETTADYTDASAPGAVTRPDEIDEQARMSARQTCADAGVEHPSIMRDCIVDVHCTGDPTYADRHARRPAPRDRLSVENAPTESLDELGCHERQFDGKTYIFCQRTTRDWQGARDFCREYDADLIKIDSADEDEFAIQAADDLMLWTWWIGLHDPDDDGTWEWVDGADPGYTNWDGGSAPGPGGDNCAAIQLLGNQWGTEACDDTYKFICEPAP